jgi:hypothetical protein
VSGTHKWLGWPLWLVTAVLVLSAVTGSAGPIQVIWALGLLWVAASIARMYLGGLRRRPRDQSRLEGDDRAKPTDSPAPPASHAGGQGSASSEG